MPIELLNCFDPESQSFRWNGCQQLFAQYMTTMP
jgi:hypothetical protein